MGKEKNKPSESEQLAYDICELVEGKPAIEGLSVLSFIVAQICSQSGNPDVVADCFIRALKITMLRIREQHNKTNKIN